MKELLKWFLKEFWYPLTLLAGIVVCIILINSILIKEPKDKFVCQPCTELRADIVDLRRSLVDQGQRVDANTNGLIALNAEVVGEGTEGYYDFKVEDENTYGIDEIPTVPLRGE